MLEKYSLELDAIISFVIGIVTFFLIAYFNLKATFGTEELSITIPLTAGILGVLITVLAILYAFEKGFENNKTMLKLKAIGVYEQIFQRFLDSVLGIFYSLVILVILFILRNKIYSIQESMPPIMVVIGLSIITFIFIRTYRCFFIFKKLQEAITKNNSTT